MTWSRDSLSPLPNYANDRFKLPEMRLTSAAKKEQHTVVQRLGVLVNQQLKRVVLSKWPKKRQTVSLFVFLETELPQTGSSSVYSSRATNIKAWIVCQVARNFTSFKHQCFGRQWKQGQPKKVVGKDLGRIRQLLRICERNTTIGSNSRACVVFFETILWM